MSGVSVNHIAILQFNDQLTPIKNLTPVAQPNDADMLVELEPLDYVTANDSRAQIWNVTLNQSLVVAQLAVYVNSDLERMEMIEMSFHGDTQLTCSLVSILRHQEVNHENEDNLLIKFLHGDITSNTSLSRVLFSCAASAFDSVTKSDNVLQQILADTFYVKFDRSSTPVRVYGITLAVSNSFRCGTPPLPINGYVRATTHVPVVINQSIHQTGTGNYTTIRTHAVKFNCNDGYAMEEDYDIICDASGRWSRSAPKCSKLEPAAPPTSEECNRCSHNSTSEICVRVTANQVTYMAIGCVLLLVVISCISCSCCVAKCSCLRTSVTQLEQCDSMDFLRPSWERASNFSRFERFERSRGHLRTFRVNKWSHDDTTESLYETSAL